MTVYTLSMMGVLQLQNLISVVALAVAGPAAAAIAIVGNGPHGGPITYVAPRADTLPIDTVVLGRMMASARNTDHSIAASGRKIRIRYKSKSARIASLAPVAGVSEPEQRSGSVTTLSALPTLKPRRATETVTRIASANPFADPLVLNDAAVIAPPIRKPRDAVADLWKEPAEITHANLHPLLPPQIVLTEPSVAAPVAKVALTRAPELADDVNAMSPPHQLPNRSTRKAAYPELAQRHPAEARHPVETKKPPVRTVSLDVARSRLPMPVLSAPVLPDETGRDDYIPWAVRQEQAKGFRAGPVHGNPHLVPHEAPFVSDHKAGTVVVHVKEKRLYLVQSPTTARVYPIGTAKGGLDILGQTRITTRRYMPVWTPTPNQRRRDPTLPRRVAAGPNNPLGVRAMGIGWRYRLIHGTSDPASIGFARSDGCIRMLNDDVADLFDRVRVGNRVVVLASANAPLTEWRPDGYQEYKPKRRKWRRKAWRKKRWKARKRYASRRSKRRRR